MIAVADKYRRSVTGDWERWCPHCDVAKARRLSTRFHECSPPCGPGCQLKRTLAWWGIRDDGKCGCADFAAEMDRWGPDGCAAREDEILAHLAEASVKRGLPFIPPAARLLIRQAIAAARRDAAAKPATPAPAATSPG